jgi:hypothetical protein
MKKLFVLLFTVFVAAFYAATVLATDICSDTPLETANFNVEITSAVNLRSISCMESSTVVAVLSKGEVVHVIGKTEGWHKIQRADGTTGWIWETFVTSTTKPFTPFGTQVPVVNEPLYDAAGHLYEDAIRFIYDKGIVQGYPDGSYKPNSTINRAELVKIVVEAVYNNEFESYGNTACFNDVKAGDWYTKYVCFAKDRGIVEGYSDGTFQPAKGVNFVEALKIVMVGYGNEYTVSDPWYKSMVELASANNIIPLDTKGFDQVFTRGQMAELVTRNIKFKEGFLNEYLGTEADQRVTYESLL